MIVTREIHEVVRMGLRDIRYEIGPLITLIDGPSFSFQWEERPKLLLGQIKGADKVALSRTDMIDPKEVEQINKTLADITGDNLLILSKQNGSSVEEMAQQILLYGPRDMPLAI